MDYKLAKQLKDAGFPLKEWQEDMKEPLMRPSLSELIEACGEDFNSLRKIFLQEDVGDTKAGDAWMSETGVLYHEKYYYGKTPEIAVANLYLALNKK